jgi:hypothetical protein
MALIEKPQNFIRAEDREKYEFSKSLKTPIFDFD